MIQLIQAPAEGSFLLDGNNTLIKIRSERGSGFYFRAKIFIDNMFFDEQGWSRLDDELAIKDLLNLYRSYFKPVFLSDVINGIVEQTHLVKKVKIVVNEYDLSDDSLVDSVQFPEYNIMYSSKPFRFDDTVSFQLLEENNEVSLFPSNGKIIIAFYNIGETDNVSIKVQRQDLSIVNTYSTVPYIGKKVFLFTYDVSTLSFNSNERYIKILFEKGNLKQERLFKIHNLPAFQITQVSFLTLFGYFKNVYFAGELENEISYKPEIYNNEQGQDVTFEVNSESAFSLNTGHLLNNEKGIIDQICTSLDVRLLYEMSFLKVVSKTAKNLVFRSKKFLYPAELKFTAKAQPWIDNLTEVNVSFMGDLEITVNELEVTPVSKDFILSYFSGNTPEKIKFKDLGRGVMKIVSATGEENMVDDQEYVLADILGFSYQSDDLLPGSESVHTSVEISINDGFWSNWGTMGITIIEESVIPPLEHPEPHYNDIDILRNSSGIGTHTIQPGFFSNYIYHSDTGHAFTVLWELVGSPASVTLVNANTAYPTINTGSGSPDSFQMKVTASCINGSGEQIINVKQWTKAIKIQNTYDVVTAGPNFGNSATWYRDLAFKITGGTPGTTINILFSADFMISSANYVVSIDYGLPSQYMFQYHGAYQINKTFNAAGEISIPVVRLTFPEASGWISPVNNINFNVSINSPSSGMIDNQFATVHFGV